MIFCLLAAEPKACMTFCSAAIFSLGQIDDFCSRKQPLISEQCQLFPFFWSKPPKRSTGKCWTKLLWFFSRLFYNWIDFKRPVFPPTRIGRAVTQGKLNSAQMSVCSASACVFACTHLAHVSPWSAVNAAFWALDTHGAWWAHIVLLWLCAEDVWQPRSSLMVGDPPCLPRGNGWFTSSSWLHLSWPLLHLCQPLSSRWVPPWFLKKDAPPPPPKFP